MESRGFEQFVAKADAALPERHGNPFAGITLVSGWARSRAIVMQRLKQLRDEGTLRLTDILRQPEPMSILALECLTHVHKGAPAQGDNPFGEMRFRFKCEATDTRQYKIGIRVVDTVDVGGGISVQGEVSEYQVLEPHYVAIPGGAEVELDVVRAVRLLQMYGRDLSRTKHQRELRPWVEMERKPADAGGFDAFKPAKRERAV